MTWFLLSKFFSNCRPKKLFNFQANNVIMSMIDASHKNTHPVHMAYSEYEIVTPNANDKVPILILHGILGSKTNWNTMSRQIAVKTLRKVLTLDARNHGDSPHTKEFSYKLMMEDLKHLMDELDIKEASLVGHSIGGRAMMAFALSNPSRVRDLVVVDVSPVGMSDSIYYIPVILRALKNVKVSSTRKPGHKVKEELDQQLKAVIKSDELRSFLLMNLAFDERKKRYYWKINLQSLMNNLPSLIDFPKFEGIFEKPTLFIAGTLSDYLKKEDEPKIRDKFSKATFVYVKDAGHLVHTQKPEEFLGLVTTFWNDQK